MKVGEKLRCPCSGDVFDGNVTNPDTIIEIVYLDRLPGQPRIFRVKPELGTFMVRASLIRAAPVNLEVAERVVTRATEDTADPRYYELPEASEAEINNTIIHVFEDNE